MKKSIVTIFFTLFILTGCFGSSIKEEILLNENDDDAYDILENVNTEDGLVIITLPESNYKDRVPDIHARMVKEPRMKESIINDDGSVTFLIKKELQVEMFEYFTEQFQTLTQQLEDNVDNSIASIVSTADFKKITINIIGDTTDDELDKIITMLGNKVIFYQLYIGFEADAVIEVIDERGEVILTNVFDDVVEE